MKLQDLKLICHYDQYSGQWLVWPELFPSIIVSVENLDDAPKEIGHAFATLYDFSLSKGNIELVELK